MQSRLQGFVSRRDQGVKRQQQKYCDTEILSGEEQTNPGGA